MAACKQANQNAIDYVLLADNDFADFTPDQVKLFAGLLKMRVRRHVSF